VTAEPVAPTPSPEPTTSAHAALRVEDLSLAYVVRGIQRPVLRGVTFDIKPGESYGLVGESGCGKSTTAYAALRYLPRNAVITGGRILVGGQDITRMNDEQVRDFRTHRASMVYQDPGAALNPTTKVGPQVAEAYTVLGQSASQARESALAAMGRVQIADPERVYQRYPHQLSGGMQQRIVIAIALACNPTLLVLDEPTTGLDATVEASVLDLVRSLVAEMDAAVLLIAHNLGVIRTMCDRVGVMYAGKIVEEGNAIGVFERPQHPYTVGLLQSLPRHGVRKSERPLATIPGTLPQIGTPLPTCVYVDRCPLATDLCREVVPPIVDVGNGQWTRCHHWERIGEIQAPPATWRSTWSMYRRRSARLATTSPPSSASTCSSAAARRSAWSASQGLASRRWPRRSSASKAPTAVAAWSSTTISSPRSRPTGRRRTSARSRWSSRTRIRHSTAVGRRATSCRAR
jgi:peptide/nickel transport system ATP-binding protein